MSIYSKFRTDRFKIGDLVKIDPEEYPETASKPMIGTIRSIVKTGLGGYEIVFPDYDSLPLSLSGQYYWHDYELLPVTGLDVMLYEAFEKD